MQFPSFWCWSCLCITQNLLAYYVYRKWDRRYEDITVYTIKDDTMMGTKKFCHCVKTWSDHITPPPTLPVPVMQIKWWQNVSKSSGITVCHTISKYQQNQTINCHIFSPSFMLWISGCWEVVFALKDLQYIITQDLQN